MNLEDTVPSEISQTQRQALHDPTFSGRLEQSGSQRQEAGRGCQVLEEVRHCSVTPGFPDSAEELLCSA